MLIITVNADIFALVFACHNVFESNILLFKTTKKMHRLINAATQKEWLSYA
jgi:hypothetical protein